MNNITGNNLPAIYVPASQSQPVSRHGVLFHCCQIAVFCALIALFRYAIPLLPIGGIVAICLFFAFPLQLMLGYKIAMKRTISSVHWLSSGLIGRLLNQRIFILFISFTMGFALSMIMCVNIAVFSDYDILSIALALLILTWKHSQVVGPIIASQAVRWEAPYYVIRSSILAAFATYFIAQFCILFLFPQIAALPPCSSLAEALEKMDIIVGKSSLVTYLCGFANIFKTTKEYYLTRVLLDMGWDSIVPVLFDISSIFCFMTVYSVLFVNKKELSRQLVEANIASSDIPAVSFRMKVIYSLLCVFFVGAVTLGLLHAEQQVSKPHVAAAIASTKEKIENTVLVFDNEFYEPAVKPAISNVFSQYQARIDAVYSQALALHTQMCGQMRANVEHYLDWHYSLSGEYTRLFNMLCGKGADYIAQKLEESIMRGVDNNTLRWAQEEIDHLVAERDKQIKAVMQRHRVSAEEAMNSKKEPFPIDVIRCIGSGNSGYTSVGGRSLFSTGSSIAAMVAIKVMSKPAMKATLTAITKFLASKGLSCLASVGTSAATGAAGGSFLPGLGTAAGAVLGAVSGVVIWVVSDAAILKLDEIASRDDMRREILETLDSECKQ